MRIFRVGVTGLVAYFFLSVGAPMAQSTNVLDFSRKSTVLLTSQSASSKGSGVFLGDQIVLTCFHVVATITVKGPNVNWSVFPDLQVVLPSGESISGTVMSVPTPADLTPLTQDFAFVKLKNKPTTAFSIAQLATDKEGLNVGDEVAFSGYPLATPGMVTHRGMVSGFDSSGALIFVQAAINKGNSGGALLNSSGHVVGLISMREGGISVGLQQLRIYIDKTSSQGSVQIMGVDPLQATKAIIETIDQYISTGIGYARAIKFAREFRNKNPGIFK